MKHYITFGQNHYHEIGDNVFDKDCVCLIDTDDHKEDGFNITGRDIAFIAFGRKWSMEYPEKYFDMDSMILFPRGIIKLKL